MSDIADVVIIGSGPAGWTAAIYATRANLKVKMFTGMQMGGTPGGQLMLTTDVENFPGFEDGILGPDLMARMTAQAKRFGAEIIEEDVIGVDFSKQPFRITSGYEGAEEQTSAKAVIIATGASALWLGLESEERLRGRGVSSCATCDGFFFRNKNVAVIGGGDTALEEAHYLAGLAKSVTVVHRRDDLRASKIMQDRARANPKISWALGNQVEDVVGDDRVEGLKIRNAASGEIQTIPVDGVFVAIGHRPNTEIFKGQVELDDAGYVIAKTHTQTSVPGVFVAGDVRDHRYRQAVTAAGEGCMAALDAEEYLAGQPLEDIELAGEYFAVATER
jgi:thioredoxin reductase (NADPH)